MLICRQGSFFLVFVSFLLVGFVSFSFAETNNSELWKSKCSSCHSPNLVKRYKNYSVNDWMQIIDRMKSAGLKITTEEQKSVASYLSENIK